MITHPVSRLYRSLSVHTKIQLAMTLALALALTLSTSALLLQQVATERVSAERRHEQIARVITANMGAALLFEDGEAANENLATVAGLDDVAWVQVFDGSPRPFAAFANAPVPGRVDRLDYPVLVDGKQIGKLEMGVRPLSLAEVVRRSALTAIASFISSLLLSLWFARWFIRVVFRPIGNLLHGLRQIVVAGNYSSRLALDRSPEYNLICTSFNAVLEEVETRTAALSDTAAELRQARDIAEEASLAKSQFLANVSHELRTPLNAIIGYTEVLQEELRDAAHDHALSRSLEDLNWIHGSARQLLELINGILDLSKIEAGGMTVDTHDTDLTKLMGEVAATLEPLAAQKRNRLQVLLDPALTQAFTDSTKLRQCLLNLGSNACKFTEDGTVFVHGRAEGADLVFSISDTGIGLSGEQRARLFQPFVQADASITRRYGGTGLGLTITWRFAAMLGGTVMVTSEPGQGSTFTLRVRANLHDVAGNPPSADLPQTEPNAAGTPAVHDHAATLSAQIGHFA